MEVWRQHPLAPPALELIPDRTRIDKVNSELVVLTYGTIVAQLCKDFDSDYVEVNKQLDKMGYNIGLRLIEDYLAKSNTMRRCSNFKETAEMIAKVGNQRAPSGARIANTVEWTGGLQDLSQHNTDHYELDKRQQTVLSRLR